MKISISDFEFKFISYGHYKVTYVSPITGKRWTTITTDMPLVDLTKNEDEPKIHNLVILKKRCKNS